MTTQDQKNGNKVNNIIHKNEGPYLRLLTVR